VTSRLADQRGLTLIELMVASSLMLIISAAALTTLEQFTRMSKTSESRLDQQDRVRQAVRAVVRDLRNVASSADRPDNIEQAGDYDVVFKTVSPVAGGGSNSQRLERVRYCLDSGTRNAAVVRRQTQSWTAPTAPGIPSTASCPSSGWETSKVVATAITNRAGTQERPVFVYRRTSAGEIQSVAVKLYLDTDPSREPREAQAETGVFLRNQNRAPVATFTATPAGVGHILLNASESVDPENQTLDIRWFDGAKLIGRGTIYDYYAKTRGVHSISIEVRDVAGLVARSGPIDVVVQ
jgi:prepilin-type N-terminal cleavage/methylation domain-containing protein